ncbi:MAG: hypothetical protein O2782_23105 [bacterium]|nr:hypothetical protein [bacterium]
MITLLLLPLLLVGAAWSVDAGDVTHKVRAEGNATVYSGDVVSACERARHAALREAVEEGVGILITSATKTSNYAVIDDRILSVTKGYVRSYELVAQSAGNDGSCQVMVDAVVDLGQLQQQLAALELAAIGAGLPRVLCVADESLGSERLAWGVVRTEMRSIVAGMTDLLDVASGEESDIDRGRADIIILGSATVLPTQSPIPMAGRLVADAGMSTAGATLRVELGWVDADRPIGVLTSSGRGAGSSPRDAGERALRHAVAIISDSLRALLAEELRQRAFSTRVVELVVEGDRVSAGLDGLVRALESGLGPLQSLTPRLIEVNQASFQIRSTASSFELARLLSARGLDDTSVEILQVTANGLRVALGSPEPAGEAK